MIELECILPKGENLHAFLEGKALRNEVDFTTGYRKQGSD